MNRRGFLSAMLAAGVAPAIVRASSLMPVISRPHVMTLAEIHARDMEFAMLWANRIVNPPVVLDMFDIDRVVLEVARVHNVPAWMLRK